MVREIHRGTCSVGDLRYRMRKPLRIHGNVSFDARYLLTRVITLLLCGICILHALCSNDHKSYLLASTTVDTDLANHIFLMPTQASLTHYHHSSFFLYGQLEK